MSKQDIRDTLETLCLGGPAIDMVMAEVGKFELEIERRRDYRREEDIRSCMRTELTDIIRKLK